MKEKLFQIFFCFYIFWSPILYSILGSSGEELDGGILRIALIIIAGISWFFYLSISPKCREERIMISLMLLFAILYYSTQFFYKDVAPDVLKLYKGQLLRWGSDCSSACAIGMTLLKLKNYDLIHKILPYESIILTPYMLSLILSNSMEYGQYSDGSGLNYQLIAYYMAVLFCFSMYYTFIYNTKQPKVLRAVTLIAMFIQAVSCCMSGGRGGVVLLALYLLYMTYYMVKQKHISLGKIVFALIAFVIGFSFIANRFNLWNSAGFRRSSSLFSTSGDRIEMWTALWHYVADNDFFPYGLGGDYFTFGFYTHNVFLDWCIELSIVGAALMVFMYWKTYKIQLKLAKSNEIFVITIILFLYGVVMNLFSGYWISTYSVWMAFGIAMTYKNYYRTPKTLKI